MTGAAKRRGDAAEREIASLLRDLTGWPVRRKLGAGRADDVGDLDGIPGAVAQVAAWADVARAAREKPVAADTQRVNAGAGLAVTFVRFPGGTWRAVMTVEQFTAWAREATA